MFTIFPKYNKTAHILFWAVLIIWGVLGWKMWEIASNDKGLETPVYAKEDTRNATSSQDVVVQEVQTENATSTLVFVGDIMLSREVGSIMKRKNDWGYPFLLASSTLQNADLTFGNLEGPISNGGIKVGSKYSFEADPQVIAGLEAAGFNVLSLANNHMWDYSSVAFRDTLTILDANSISHVGAGRTYDEAHMPVIKEVHGVKIAYLAYTNLLPASLGTRGDKDTVAAFDREQMSLDIQHAKQVADIVVTSFHWGEEYQTAHNAAQEDLAHFAIDTGVDLVIGHHPHVVQEVEQYKGKYVVYSLGNFVFDQNFSPDTKNGLMLTVSLEGKNITEVKPQRVEFTSTYQPFLVSTP